MEREMQIHYVRKKNAIIILMAWTFLNAHAKCKPNTQQNT